MSCCTKYHRYIYLHFMMWHTSRFRRLLGCLSELFGSMFCALLVDILPISECISDAVQLLTKANIPCSYSYSALDPTARKITVAKFRNRLTRVLMVTDLAARGIDIPMLDVVINFNFPAKPKLFVHRVGQWRCSFVLVLCFVCTCIFTEM